MEKKISLQKLSKQTNLWTGEQGRIYQKDIAAALVTLSPGDTLVIDMKDVQAINYSFVNNFFGRTILDLPSQYNNRFFIVENLTKDNYSELEVSLSTLGLAMIERKNDDLRLVGKVHPANSQNV